MNQHRSFNYDGLCNICGTSGQFTADFNGPNVTQQFVCQSCGANLRFRDDAAALLEWAGRGKHIALSTLVKDERLQDLAIYNVGKEGPVRNLLQELPGYTESFYWEDGEPGEVRNGLQHQDLQQLTFDDDSFDLVISSHVLEHVASPQKAFEEVFRVLRPGGVHIFSIPFHWPPKKESIVRAEVVNGELVHHLEPHYHGSPEGVPALVFTNFGVDLLDMLEDIGYQVQVKRPHINIDFAFQNAVFLSIKPSR